MVFAFNLRTAGGCKQFLQGKPSHATCDILCTRNGAFEKFFHAMVTHNGNVYKCEYSSQQLV